MTEKNTPINEVHSIKEVYYSVEKGLVYWLIDSSKTYREIEKMKSASKALLKAILDWGELKLKKIKSGESDMEEIYIKEINREEIDIKAILRNFETPSAYRSYCLKLINERYDDKIEQNLEQIKQELTEANPPAIKLNVPGLKKTWGSNLNLGRDSLKPNTPLRRQLEDNSIIPREVLEIIAGIIAEKGLNFSGSNFSKAVIRGAIFSGARLGGADFSEAKLRAANFSRARLGGAKLLGAELIGAIFSGAELSGADIRGAELRGAKFIGANLSGTDLSGADIRGATFFSTEELGEPAEELSVRFIGIRGLTESQISDLSPKQQTKLREVLKHNNIEITPLGVINEASWREGREGR